MSKIKCPFCQQEMRRTNGTHNKVGVWQCQNSNDPDNVCIASGYLFNDDVLNYIARTRKALEILQEFVTKLYLNGNITDEQLERYKKMLIRELEPKENDNVSKR